jgi:hypothetical protein
MTSRGGKKMDKAADKQPYRWESLKALCGKD